MPNARIISDNAADRATLTASSSASGYPVANLLTEDKSIVWRSIGTTAALTLTWPALEPVSCAALPFCNLSPTATVRVRTTDEAQATNTILQSQTFDNASWAKTNATVTANATAAPDGTTTADAIFETAIASADHHVYQTFAGLSGVRTYSVFVKANGRTYVQLTGIDNAVTFRPIFNLSNGTVTNNGGVTAAITSAGNGWYRCSWTKTCTSLTQVAVLAQSGSTYVSYTGVTTSGLYVWGAQVEAGNLSSYYPTTTAANTRPLGYIDAWQSYSYDSGNVLACPAPAIKLRGWTAAQASSAYAYGGGAYARHWFGEVQAYGVKIDIADASNLQGYTEAARLIVGPYWSPTYNASAAPLATVDSTALYRNGAGGQMADAGTIHRKLSIDFSMMPADDRAKLANLLLQSRAYPLLISVFPENADAALERDYMIYGRRTENSEVSIAFAGAYGTKIPIEEV